MRTLTTMAAAITLVCSIDAAAQPGQGPPPPPCAASDTQYVCGQQAPEDLVVVPGGQWVVAGAFSGPGGVNLIKVSDRTTVRAYPTPDGKERLDARTYATCPGAPDAGFKAKFQTHGLYLLPGANSVHRLFVVVHGARESVEVFELDARSATPALTWIGCAVAPDPIGLNSVRGLPDGGFIATNFLARNITLEDRDKVLAGERNGELWEWHTASAWQKVPGSEAAGANGLEISHDGKWHYVAAWGSQSFFRLSRGPGVPKREEIPLGFRVDNIRWARDGSLLAAGQTDTATVIVKIDPQGLKVREIFRRTDSPAFRAGTVAVEIGDRLWVGSYLSDRIAIVAAK